jgi:hypothetical protein
MMCDQLSVYNTAKLSWNQTQIANEQLRRDAAWEVTGVGHVVVESMNEQGAFAATAARAQYMAIHNMLRVEGAPREAAVIEQTPAGSQTGQPPVRAEISTGSINLKTGEMDLQISRIRADLSNRLNPAASNQQPPNPKVNPNPSQGNPGNSSNLPSIESPRDSYPLRRP